MPCFFNLLFNKLLTFHIYFYEGLIIKVWKYFRENSSFSFWVRSTIDMFIVQIRLNRNYFAIHYKKVIRVCNEKDWVVPNGKDCMRCLYLYLIILLLISEYHICIIAFDRRITITWLFKKIRIIRHEIKQIFVPSTSTFRKLLMLISKKIRQ